MRGTRRAIGLAAVSAAARTPAFIIPVVIAAVFGASRQTDAYFIAYSAVLFLGGTLAQGLEQAVVPFAAKEIHWRPGLARRYLDRAARWASLAASAAWLVGVPLFALAAGALARWEVLGFAVLFTPLALAWCGAAVYSGALVSQWKIATATGSLLWRGLGAAIGVALIPLGGGLSGVALGLGVGEVCRVWWLRSRLFTAVELGGPGEPERLKTLSMAAGAQIAASAAIAGAPVIERMLAVGLGPGAVSHLEYASRLLIIPGVLFDGALAPLLLARWTETITRSGSTPSRRAVLRSVGRGVGLAAGCGAALAVSAGPLVHLLLGHGRFGTADEVAVASLLRVLSIAFVATMGALLLERYYLAAVRNRALAALSLARAGVRVATVVLLLPSLGLLAFGVGYAFADWLYLLALVALLRPSSVAFAPARDPEMGET
jgi:putative peptidoglycan lipid II flippase